MQLACPTPHGSDRYVRLSGGNQDLRATFPGLRWDGLRGLLSLTGTEATQTPGTVSVSYSAINSLAWKEIYSE